MAKKKQAKQTKQTEDKELLEYARYCPECKQDLIPDSTGTLKVNFCPDCGTKLIQPSRCLWCRSPVNASAIYCTGCGELILRKE